MPVLKFRRPTEATQCTVRLRNERPDGFIKFDFSVGDPDLSVELIMPRAAFHEFCATQRARVLTPDEGRRIDEEQSKWRYGRPGLTE